ncbi:MAG: prolipoprotein diacylglyceryl transferase, partial [Pseudomonadota bacterium]
WSGKPPLTVDQTDTMLLVAALGVVLGGRLGFVLFYKPDYYFANPGEILQLWKGGMAFHGGLVGTGIALFLYAKATGAKVLSVFDLAAAATPIGLFFGRIANFINGEVYGRPSEVPWAVVVPADVLMRNPDGTLRHAEVPRHPSQLYEAALEGLVLLLVMWWLALARGWLKRPGALIGVFFVGYGAARSFVENFRQGNIEFVTPDNPWGHSIRFGAGPDALGLTMGQILSLPMIAIGLAFIWYAYAQARSAPEQPAP